MVLAGRDLWTSSCATPLLKQGHLEPIALDHVQMVVHLFQVFLHIFLILYIFEINPGGFKCLGGLIINLFFLIQ